MKLLTFLLLTLAISNFASSMTIGQWTKTNPSKSKCRSSYSDYGSKADLKFHGRGGYPKDNKGRKITTIVYEDYVVGLGNFERTPLWTQRNFGRYPKNCQVTGRGAHKFKCDPKLPLELVTTHDDFKDDACSSKDKERKKRECMARGHLTANADMCDLDKRKATFVTTNIAPQVQNSFNAGAWSKLEGCVQSWAKKNNNLSVTTGVIHLDKTMVPFLNKKVGVPIFFYKIIVDRTKKDAVAYLFENRYYEKKERKLDLYRAPIANLETFSGMEFYNELNLNKEKANLSRRWNCGV